jgi:hypothetical protein
VRKIPTLFRRDPDDMKRVTREVHPDCQWVLDGEGVATRKYDGTCLRKDEQGNWWARREVKAGKATPPNFVPVETDPQTGKMVGWEPVEQSAFFRWFEDARTAAKREGWVSGEYPVGTYELVGQKVNGNPERFPGHMLVAHAAASVLEPVPRDYDGLAAYLADLPHEGIVWHHPDGRMAKIKVRDFG